ncbi:hypothetical protein [Ursidibacter sp. B-7004-1]
MVQLENSLRNYISLILDIFSYLNVPSMYVEEVKAYLLTPNMPYIVVGVALSYVIICGVVNVNSEKRAFFFNSLDMLITLMVVIIPIVTNILNDKKYISADVQFWLNILLLTILFLLMWVITYRANGGEFFSTFFMFLGKILFIFVLGVILIVGILVTMLAIALATVMKREKYQRRETHKRNQVRTAIAPVGGTIFVICGLMRFCIKYPGFSMPAKVVKQVKNDVLVNDEEESNV